MPGNFRVLVPLDSLDVTIQLVPLPTVLRPITVAAPRLNAWLVDRGFYRRMRQGLRGMFITPEEIQSLKPQRTTEILQDRTGVRITYSGGFGKSATPLIWGRNYCLLNIFVDGLEILGIYDRSRDERRGGVSFFGSPGFRSLGNPAAPRPITGLGIDALMDPNQIAAIEIYSSGPGTPMEFQTTNECGAIVIWTKVGAVPAPGDSSEIPTPPADSGGLGM